MWAKPAASRSTVTAASRPATWSVPAVCGIARFGDPDQRARPGRHGDDDHDEQDDDHPLHDPHGRPPTLSRASAVPRPAASARRTIASAKTTSASPTPRCVTTTRPLEGRGGPGEDRHAERRDRVGVAIELAGIAVRHELAAIVDEEQGRLLGDLGRAHRGVVDRDDERIGRQPVGGHRLAICRVRERGRGDHDVGLGDRVARLGDRVRGRDPGRRPGGLGEGLGAFRVAVVDRKLDPRQDVAEHLEVAVALDAGPDDRRPRRRRPAELSRAEERQRHARHRRRPLRGDRAAIEDGPRYAGRRIVEDHDRVDRGQPARPVLREPRDPLHPEQVASPSGSRRAAGIACANEPAGRGWTPILGGSSASATSAVMVRSARARRSATGGIAAVTSAAERYLVTTGSMHRESRWRTGVVRDGVDVRRQNAHAGTMRRVAPIDLATSLENLKLERDAIVLYDSLAEIEKDQTRADAFRRIAANERRHADIWARKLTELGATVPPADGPRPRVRFIMLIARLFGTRSVAELVKALEGDEEEAYESPGGSPEVAAIAADEREHAEIWERLAEGKAMPMVATATASPPRRRPPRPPRSAGASRGIARALGRARSARSSSA